MARRLTKVSFDWNALVERVPANAKPQLNALKSRADSNLRRMLALPENPPPINWAFYKSKVAKPALVDDFQKKYEALQIPFPADTVTAKINELEKEMMKILSEELAGSKKVVQEAEAKLAVLNDQLPITSMTIQELAEVHPSIVPDGLNDPTPWPHDPEEIQEWREREALKKAGKAPAPVPAAH